jgi:hypothetical protein
MNMLPTSGETPFFGKREAGIKIKKRAPGGTPGALKKENIGNFGEIGIFGEKSIIERQGYVEIASGVRVLGIE